MAKSKFFRVAVEGATTDGRVIERSWIDEMAANYHRETYGARVNMEHIRGFSADPPFNAYGDVLALEARDIEIQLAGKQVKRRALYAQIEPTEQLVAINRKNQKLYTSVEIQPNFAATGKAGLVGLAVTDSPASLGTEILAFAAQAGDKNPFTARKADPANLISAAEEFTLELEADAPAATAEHTGLFAAATEFFKSFGKPPEPEKPKDEPSPANDNDQRFAAIGQGLEKMTAGIASLSTAITADLGALRRDHDALKASIDQTPNTQTNRPPATGGGSYAATDC